MDDAYTSKHSILELLLLKPRNAFYCLLSEDMPVTGYGSRDSISSCDDQALSRAEEYSFSPKI